MDWISLIIITITIIGERIRLDKNFKTVGQELIGIKKSQFIVMNEN